MLSTRGGLAILFDLLCSMAELVSPIMYLLMYSHPLL
jgi:hypothetical protein